jgi:hypothetical protein
VEEKEGGENERAGLATGLAGWGKGGRPAGLGQRLSGPNAERREGDQGEIFFFSFYKTILNFHFQKILNSFLNSVKTTHHIKRYATTGVHKHVSTLIFAFNFVKIIISLS